MLKYRLVSGFTLAAIVLTALFVQGYAGVAAFLILATVMMAGALNEFFTMTEKIGHQGFKKMTIFVGLLLLASVAIPNMLQSSYSLDLAFAELLTIIFITFGFLRVFNEETHSKGLSRLFVSIAGLIYIAWTLLFISKIYFLDGIEMSGRYFVLYLIAVTKFSDIGAYATGNICHRLMPWDNHKIAPKLSPGKSWEGFFGGIAFSIGIALTIRHYLGDQMLINGNEVISVWVAVVTGAAFATLGFIGDVAESALKRASGMKDSGNTIPGMGGVMDVVDSLILVSPLFYCLLSAMIQNS